MDETKERLIADLYSLRATLSAISAERDIHDELTRKFNAEKQACKEKISSLKSALIESDRAIHECRVLTANRDSTIAKFNREYNRKIREIDTAKSHVARRSASVATNILLGLLCAVGILGVGAACGLYFYHYWIAGTFGDLFFPLNILAFAGGVLSAAGAIASVVFAVIVFKHFLSNCSDKIYKTNKNEMREKARRSRDDKIRNYEKKCADAQEKSAAAERDSERYGKEIEVLQSKSDSIDAKYTQPIESAVSNCKAIDSFATNNYSKILSVSDWDDLDLIIYYLETNRADTIKEALQLKDRQRQNDELVKAIDNAGQSISDTISGGFMQMRTDMVKCFAIVSKQIQIVAEQQDSRMRAIENSIDGMKGAVFSLAGAVNVQNALQAKANATSAQLVGDMNYMRTLAENAEVRRRNNC